MCKSTFEPIEQRPIYQVYGRRKKISRILTNIHLVITLTIKWILARKNKARKKHYVPYLIYVISILHKPSSIAGLGSILYAS